MGNLGVVTGYKRQETTTKEAPMSATLSFNPLYQFIRVGCKGHLS